MKARLLLCALVMVFSQPANTQSRLPDSEWANQQLPDPQQEAQARELMESIRCLVCQGQSIADSDADMASDMRALVRRRIAAGENPDEIRAWLVERYGRWISYNPPLDAVTWPLWILPLLFVGGGLWLVRGRIRFGRRKR